MKEKILTYFRSDFKTFYCKYLQKVKAIGGDEYQAICPFHDDTKPSFNFNNQTGQYFCHGCNKKGDIFHFYGKINDKRTKGDFGPILKGIADDFGISWEEKKSHIVKTYDYTDAEGKLLFQVCRMEPKDFRQRRPDGQGGWIWDLKGVDPVLYHLPELKANEVIIVEGEKDSNNLMDLGFIATCNPGGAGKWRDEYGEILKGKDIVLIPDNDNPGREHMTKVAISLNGTVKSLKWLELPGLPSKGDVSDWIATYKDKDDATERLAIMIEGAEPYQPPKKASLEDAVLELKDFSILELPSKNKILEPWLSEQSISLISGWRGTGKTWFALSLVDAISKGESFGPWKTITPVPCLFLDGEMPAQDIKERTDSLDNGLDRKCPLYIYSDAYANSLGLPRAHLIYETWRTKMKSVLIAKKVKLWVIDNLASLASGLDENAKKDWDPINQWLLELRFAGIATMMLHHVNKEGGQRGTSAREDNLDISIMLKTPPDYVPEDGARFITRFTKARVSTKDLQSISDTEFKLTLDESNRLVWTWGNVKKETRKAVLEMINDDIDNKVIYETLGISKGRVSQIKKQAVKDGYLTAKGSLTAEGYLLINED